VQGPGDTDIRFQQKAFIMPQGRRNNLVRSPIATRRIVDYNINALDRRLKEIGTETPPDAVILEDPEGRERTGHRFKDGMR